MDFTPYLDMMVRHKASDIFVTAGSPVRIKIDGRLRDVEETIYDPEMCRDAVCSLMNEHQITEYDERRELDFAVGLKDKGRFRVNAFHQRGAPGMVIRYLSNRILTCEELGLPEVLNNGGHAQARHRADGRCHRLR